MTAPHVYAEWLPLLDRFRDGDDTALETMQSGTIEWSDGVAERWTSRLDEVLHARLETISRQLQRALGRAAGDSFAIGNALMAARRALDKVRPFTELRAAPVHVRTHLESQLARFVTQTQESLEHGVRHIRHDGGQLLKTLRDHALTRPAAAAATPDEPESPQPARGRRVLL